MATVSLKNVKKIYPNGTEAVKDFSLDIADNEFVVLVGPSGCGKSTLLRMVAGLENITDGEVYIDGTFVSNMPPKDRDIAMVFQSHALYPHFTVFDNIEFPLKVRKEKKEIIRERVQEIASVLGIEHLLKRRPNMISGGEGQRVAMGRALIRKPKVFLMDEPLSNLDAKLRTQMRAEIVRLRERFQTTFIYVTHDQIEAMALGDRIVVMKDGVIQQTGTPEDIFRRPENTFVASFVGSPQMNMLRGRLFADGGVSYLGVGDAVSKLGTTEEMNGEERAVTVGLRPHDLKINGGEMRLKCLYEYAEELGDETHIHLRFGDDELTAKTSSAKTIRYLRGLGGKKELDIGFDIQAVHCFDSETGKRIGIPSVK